MSRLSFCRRAAPVAVLLMGSMLAACSPESMETTPVEIATPKGTVICQLYSRSMVYWDRAIHTPPGMTPDEADAVCKKRGLDDKNGVI